MPRREPPDSSVVVVVESLSHVRLFETPWTVACRTLLSVGFSKARILERLSFCSAGVFLTQGLNPCLLQVDSLPLSHLRIATLPIKIKKED